MALEEVTQGIKDASDRVYNFSAGPCMLPLEVLDKVQRELLSYQGSGMSVMELSHRSKEFLGIQNKAEADLRDILKVPETHKLVFLQGGATLQFSAVPLNMMGSGRTFADYAQTGQWGEKAQKEATKYRGDAKIP